MMQLKIAMTVKCTQITGSRGSLWRPISMKTASTIAPRITRDHAIWVNETPVSATFMKRKLEPQIRPIPRNCSRIVERRSSARVSFTSRHYCQRVTLISRAAPCQPVPLLLNVDGAGAGDPLVVVDDLGDDEVQELLRELRVEVRLDGERSEAGDLHLLPLRVGWREPRGGLHPAHLLGELEPLGENVD